MSHELGLHVPAGRGCIVPSNEWEHCVLITVPSQAHQQGGREYRTLQISRVGEADRAQQILLWKAPFIPACSKNPNLKAAVEKKKLPGCVTSNELLYPVKELGTDALAAPHGLGAF